MPESPSSFVFLDPSGKRWPQLRTVLFWSGMLIFILLVLFVRSLLITPQLRLPANVLQAQRQLKALREQAAEPLPKTQWLKYLSPSQIPAPKWAAGWRAATAAHVRLGYYVSWDPNSIDSFRAHADQLTHVAPEWFSLVDASGKMTSEPDNRVLEIAARHGVTVFPLLNNLSGDTWQPEAVEGLVNGPRDVQTRFIEELLSQIRQIHAGGILLDWQQIDPAYQSQLTAFLSSMAETFHAANKEVWVSIPLDSELKAYDLTVLPGRIDRFVAQLHDENSEADDPGPVASQDWCEGWLKAILAYGDPQQWVIALGAYGYSWTEGQKTAEVISCSQALELAHDAGVADLQLHEPSWNPRFSFMQDQVKHTVWFLDAITFFNQARFALAQHVGGVGINRLGAEDPQLWKTLNLCDKNPVTDPELADLQELPARDSVTQVGEGEFLTVDRKSEDGFREVRMNPNGRATETYRKMPDYPTVYHDGQTDEHAVTLTFDDGPDPTWTPRILDILKARRIPAAFFIVGSQAEDHPDLVARILREGHEIGNHTYFHPNLAAISPERIKMEINATQLLLESLTGRSTVLFRPPYNADSQPQHPDELLPISIAQDMGYVTVAENIDPEDWAEPGANVIVQKVKQLRRMGHIILLHDAGGDRSQTVAALPQIIDYLQTRGDHFVPLSQLLGLTHDQVMPPLPNQRAPISQMVSGAGFRTLRVLEECLWAFMMIATALVFIRTLLVAWLATRPNRNAAPPPAGAPTPPLSILIAAYNEEKVIRSTLHSVLHTDYPGSIEVIVVDDGSKDHTARIIEGVAETDPRVRIIRQPNWGKAHALSNALKAANHEWVVMLDADTRFQPDTLRHLVAPLHHAEIVAVSGRARVGNPRNWITRFQSLEYICGFNLDRQAYHVWNCITVVPGAISAYRRGAILAAGGLRADTLAEDTDLTLCLHRRHGRIAYAPGAVAWTEAPETLQNLFKQRFRWAFGTLQCLWKHRDLVFNPEYKALGWFSLPNIWFFQIVLVSCVPAIDALLILSLLTRGSGPLLIYFLIFLTLDLITACLACLLEKEKLSTALLVLPMRFIYRPLLSWVVWRSLRKAVQGALVGWGKFDRSASVHPQTQAT